MKTIVALVVAALLSGISYAAGKDSDTYHCEFWRTDFGNEQKIDAYELANAEGAEVSRGYDELNLDTVCQIIRGEDDSFQKLFCMIVDTERGVAASTAVKPGTDYVNVGLVTASPAAAYDLSCNL